MSPQDSYSWDQDDTDVVVSCPFPADACKQDVQCTIRQRYLRLSIGTIRVCEGALSGKVDPEQSSWQLSSGGERGGSRSVIVSLSKDLGEGNASRQSGPAVWRYLWKSQEVEEDVTEVSVAGGGLPFDIGGAPSLVVGSATDSGDGSEDVEKQLANERFLEPLYHKYLCEKGIDDAETLDVFFRLYHEKIQLYRVNDLDEQLQKVLPACRKLGGTYKIQGVQALSVVRWKQQRYKEAMVLMLELESLVGKNLALCENIGHTHVALGDFTKAEKRFNEAMELCKAKHGKTQEPLASIWLGLGQVHKNMERHEKELFCLQKSYDLYRQAARGRPSSLQAKAALSLAEVLSRQGQPQRAESLLREAIPLFETTCGVESPLLANPHRELGLLLASTRPAESRVHLLRSYELEVSMDAWNIIRVATVHQMLMSTHCLNDAVRDVDQVHRYFGVMDKAVARARREPKAPDVAMFLGIVGEARLIGLDPEASRALLAEAVEALKSLGSDAPPEALLQTERLLSCAEEVCKAAPSKKLTGSVTGRGDVSVPSPSAASGSSELADDGFRWFVGTSGIRFAATPKLPGCLGPSETVSRTCSGYDGCESGIGSTLGVNYFSESSSPAPASQRSCVVGSSFDDLREENVEDQLENERILEPEYQRLLRERGVDDIQTLDTFFRLYHEKIQLYRLDDLDKYLQDVVPACRRKGGKLQLQGLQSLSVVRFKQMRYHDVLDLLLEMESLYGGRDAKLSENIGQAHLMLGDPHSAQARFEEVLQLNDIHGVQDVPAGSLLGLGQAHMQLGDVDKALSYGQRAYNHYQARARGRPSSLVAKAGSFLAMAHSCVGNTGDAEALLVEAITLYEATCGSSSPLVGNACGDLGLLLLHTGRVQDCRVHLQRAYLIEAEKDALDPTRIIKLHRSFVSTFSLNVESVDRTQFRQYFDLVDRVADRLRKEFADQAHVAIYYKLAGEVKLWGADYAGARMLIAESLEVMKADDMMPDKVRDIAESQIAHLLQLCDSCLSGEQTPPMVIDVGKTEYRLLRPGKV